MSQFVSLQSVGSGDRNQVRHFSYPGRHTLYFSSKLCIANCQFSPHRLHKNCRNRHHHQKKRQEFRHTDSGDHQGTQHIANSSQSPIKKLTHHVNNRFHIAYDLCLQNPCTGSCVISNRKTLKLQRQSITQSSFHAT